jgi:hypothetical protein
MHSSKAYEILAKNGNSKPEYYSSRVVFCVCVCVVECQHYLCVLLSVSIICVCGIECQYYLCVYS